MFLAVGKEVVYLKRERMGALVLDEEIAEISPSELKSIL